MSTTAPEPVVLNQDQADRILEYAIQNRMYEAGAEGLVAVDPQTRLNDAATLAFQAKRAHGAGNVGEHVMEVLFIAEVEQRPIPGSTPAAAAPAAPAPAPPAVAAPAAVPQADPDPYAESSVEQLEQALQVFRSSPANPAIQAEIVRIEATLNQRRSSAQTTPAQEVTPPAAPPAPAAAPIPSPEQPAVASVPAPSAPPAPGGTAPAPVAPAVAGPEPHIAPQHNYLPPVPGRPNPGVISPGGIPEDAASVPGPEAAQPSPQGQLPVPQAPAQNGDRSQLLSRLTFGSLQAYGLTMEAAMQLSDDQIQMIIDNPGGPQVQPTSPMPDQQPATVPAVSPEREKLESQVTGPMLKAWKLGRKSIPDMSDEELKLMVENPGGRPVAALDQSQQPEVAAVVPPAAEQVPAPLAPAPAPPVAESPQPDAGSVPPEQPVATPLPLAAPAPSSPPVPVARPASDVGQVNAAMEIIAREHFPIPPDIEDPYILPNDVSKVSDDELRSLHARAHAVEARINWVLSEFDDEIGDLERLLSDRRRVVKLQTPTSEDGKRLTKDQVEARVEADEQVQAFIGQIKDIHKSTGKLKVIRDNAHRDCERLSRQWSMRFKEENFSPSR